MSVVAIGYLVESAGERAGLPFPITTHMLRHRTGYALAGKTPSPRFLPVTSGTLRGAPVYVGDLSGAS